METKDMATNTEKLKSENFNGLDAPDPLHKYESIRRWKPLIVDESKLEEVILKNFDSGMEEKLKDTFLKLLEENIFKISDDVLEKWMDKILENVGAKIFAYVLEEQMKFWQDIQERVDEEEVEMEKDELEEGEIKE